MNNTGSVSPNNVRNSGEQYGPWWERRQFLFAIALLSALPLLWPDIPPLIDLPGHIGRYRVELDLHSSTDLQRYYEFNWALIGNLGVDLLIVPLAPIIGLEPAVKLIVICIPILTVLGFFAVAQEIHGHVPPTALFAVPFVYSQPFSYGFVNFALSVGLSLLAFALWLRLSRIGKFRTCAVLFVPISCVLWVVHAFGWGFLGLLAFSAELIRLRAERLAWISTLRLTLTWMVPLSIPIILVTREWGPGAVTSTAEFFVFASKLRALLYSLRDQWLWWDTLGLAVVFMLIGVAVFEKRFRFSARLGIPAAALGIAFAFLPFRLFGSAHADMRIIPYVLAIAVLAIRVDSPSSKLKTSTCRARTGVPFAPPGREHCQLLHRRSGLARKTCRAQPYPRRRSGPDTCGRSMRNRLAAPSPFACGRAGRGKKEWLFQRSMAGSRCATPKRKIYRCGSVC